MNRALIIINDQHDRDRACRWAQGVPFGSRIEFKETKRSLPQNDRFWAMLTDIAAHMKKQGRDHTTEQWKTIFMAAYGHEVSFLPSLDTKTFIPLGLSSSDLSVKEMTDLIEFMLAWGAENNVQFKDSGEPSPSSETPEAPASASGDEAGIDPPSESASSTLARTDRTDMIECAKEMLALSSIDWSKESDLDGSFEQARTEWKAKLPEELHGHIDDACRAARLVATGGRKREPVITFISERIGCHPSEIGGGNG